MTGCGEIDTADPEEVYYHWSDGARPDGVQLLKGKYWQSAHWSREYVMFLQVQPTQEWWENFKKINDLESSRIDKVGVSSAEIYKVDAPEWIKKPDWFTPDQNSEVYGQFGGSKYFWDAEREMLFIYEIQL